MKTKPKMTIIGFGRMGRYYGEVFRHGFDITVISSRDVGIEAAALGLKQAKNRDDAVKTADYILMTIPLSAFNSVISLINTSAKSEAVVIDVCSAQIAAEEELSALHCRHFGIHAGALIGEADSIIVEFLDKHERKYTRMSAEEHDKLTATGLVHFLVMAIDLYLGIEGKKELETGTVGPLFLKVNNPPASWGASSAPRQVRI